jgi:ubiquitin-conjugating enzyme E2 A
MARRRLFGDLKTLQKTNPDGIAGEPDGDNVFLWHCVIHGPKHTDWEGGIWKLILRFPESYPIAPPNAHFVTPIFHPNISSQGDVCVDVLQMNWSSTSDVISILIWLQVLLTCPNVASPANQEAANLFKCDAQAYSRKVKEFTYASVRST